MLASILGALVAAALAVTAFVRARALSGFYDGEVYAMTPKTHRMYGFGFIVIAVLFAAADVPEWPRPTMALWVALSVVGILYLTSFLRGASDADD